MWSDLRLALDRASGRWMDILLLSLGALVGWMTHPLVWIVCGPFGFVRSMIATASQESGFNRSAAGDGGASVGIVQFHYSSWPTLTGLGLEYRTQPFLSGYFSAKYVQDGLLTSWSWWPVLVRPGWSGLGALRAMWTHGRTERVGVAFARESWSAEITPAVRGGYWLGWILTVVPTILLLGGLLGALRRWRKRRSR